MKKLFTLLFSTVAIIVCAQNRVVVVAYNPAPGQFVNVLPVATAADDSASVIAAAQKNLDRSGGLISLGAYGGSLIVKFEKGIQNLHQGFDFIVLGNSHDTSAEPGVVMVSADENGNGLPDDPWYELAGSEYESAIHNYSITYYRPRAVDDQSTEDIANYIAWRDNLGQTGYVAKNTYHNQSYYPLWEQCDSLVFEGTLLPDNAYDTVINNYPSIALRPYAWGYADNWGNDKRELCSFKTDWAVDNQGNSVQLDSINFVKIYTGVNAQNGALGEVSTEVSAIEDLRSIVGVETVFAPQYFVHNKTVFFTEPTQADAVLYTAAGQQIATYPQGITQIDLSSMPSGIYLVRISRAVIKAAI